MRSTCSPSASLLASRASGIARVLRPEPPPTTDLKPTPVVATPPPAHHVSYHAYAVHSAIGAEVRVLALQDLQDGRMTETLSGTPATAAATSRDEVRAVAPEVDFDKAGPTN